MKNGRLCLGVMLIFFVPSILIGQAADDEQASQPKSSQSLFGNPLTGGSSLLDPARFSMSHSYMLSYLSSRGKGEMVGLYLNTMKYAFSDPLSLTVHLGYLHQPFSVSGTQNTSANSAILSGFELSYQPKKNFFLKIEYGAVPYQHNPYYWGRNRSGW